jgi:hypothetical protein
MRNLGSYMKQKERKRHEIIIIISFRFFPTFFVCDFSEIGEISEVQLI